MFSFLVLWSLFTCGELKVMQVADWAFEPGTANLVRLGTYTPRIVRPAKVGWDK